MCRGSSGKTERSCDNHWFQMLGLCWLRVRPPIGFRSFHLHFFLEDGLICCLSPASITGFLIISFHYVTTVYIKIYFMKYRLSRGIQDKGCSIIRSKYWLEAGSP